MRDTAALVGGDVTAMVFFMAVAKADLLRQRACSVEAAPATINAIAQSLKRRHQTLYGQRDALIDAGLCVMDGQSLIPAATPDIAAWLAAIRDRAVLMIDELRAAMVPLPAAVEGDVAHLDRELAIFGLRMNLVGVEYNGPEHSNWAETCITGVVMAHNVRSLTQTYISAGTFGHDVAPADERTPMLMADAAAALNMPYSTLARHAARMVANGRLDRSDKGLLLSPEWIRQPSVLDRAVEIANYVGRRMHELQNHGFDFTQPLRHRNAVPPVAA